MRPFAVDDDESQTRRRTPAGKGERRMRSLGRRSTVPAAALLVAGLAAAVGLSTPWQEPPHPMPANWSPMVAVPDLPASVMDAPPGQATPGGAPSAASLAAVADYVSPDGSYVRIGPVEISSTGPVGRPLASL
jgi:hypothetical protein